MADLERVCIHHLYHTVASVTVMDGMPLPKIGVLLGQTKAQMATRYTHLEVRPLLETAERVGQKLFATQ